MLGYQTNWADIRPKNPTGVDPTDAQWKELSEIMKEKKHFSFFDMVRFLSFPLNTYLNYLRRRTDTRIGIPRFRIG